MSFIKTREYFNNDRLPFTVAEEEFGDVLPGNEQEKSKIVHSSLVDTHVKKRFNFSGNDLGDETDLGNYVYGATSTPSDSYKRIQDYFRNIESLGIKPEAVNKDDKILKRSTAAIVPPVPKFMKDLAIDSANQFMGSVAKSGFDMGEFVTRIIPKGIETHRTFHLPNTEDEKKMRELQNEVRSITGDSDFFAESTDTNSLESMLSGGNEPEGLDKLSGKTFQDVQKKLFEIRRLFLKSKRLKEKNSAEQLEKSFLDQFGKEFGNMQESIEQTYKVTPEFQKSFLGKFTGAAGSLPIFAVGGGLSVKSKLIGKLIGNTILIGSHVGENQDAFLQRIGKTKETATQQELNAAFGSAVIKALPQALFTKVAADQQFRTVFDLATKTTRKELVKAIPKAFLVGGVSETIEERTTQLIGDVATQILEDENHKIVDLSPEGLIQEVQNSIISFVLGGGTKASFDFAGGIDQRRLKILMADGLPASDQELDAIRESVTDEEVQDSFAEIEGGDKAANAVIKALNGDKKARDHILNNSVPEENKPNNQKTKTNKDTIQLKIQTSKDIRDAVGLEENEREKRRELEADLTEAKDKKLTEKTENVSKDILNPKHSKKSFDALEHAAATIKVGELLNARDELIQQQVKAIKEGDEKTFNDKQIEISEIDQSIDLITRASDTSGTEASRVLNIRRLILKRDDFSITALQNKAIAAKKAELTPEELKKITEAAKDVKKAQEKYDEIEKEIKSEIGDKTKGRITLEGLTDKQIKKIVDAAIKLEQEKRKASNLIEGIRKLSALGLVGDALTLSRPILTMLDLSFVGNQGLFWAFTHPVIATKTLKDGFVTFFNSHTYDQIMEMHKLHPNHDKRIKAGLELTEIGKKRDNQREELFDNNIALFLPGVKRSERSFVAMGNTLRILAFDQYLNAFPDASTKELKFVADFINKMSGRGHLGHPSGISKLIAKGFFAPRFTVSTFQAPVVPFRAWNEKRVRNYIFKDMAKFLGVGLAMMWFAKMAGFEVGDDPDSSDFGRIIIGNWRWDVFGRFAQVFRLFAILASQTSKNYGEEEAGRDIDLYQASGRFLSYKLSPSITLPKEVLTGKNVFGGDISLQETFRNHFIPIGIKEISETLNSDEGLPITTTNIGMAITGFATRIDNKEKKKSKSKKIKKL